MMRARVDRLGAGDLVTLWAEEPTTAIRPPAGGRAPGWQAGIIMARRREHSDERPIHGVEPRPVP
jgi:hypothetical protein